MKRIIEVKAKRGDMKVGTLETKSPLFQAFPKGSVVVLKPNGKDARSDMEIGTLRKEWAAHEKVTPETYRNSATEVVEVDVNPLGTIGALKTKMAEALGLPKAALELRLKDGEAANPSTRVAKFFETWGVS